MYLGGIFDLIDIIKNKFRKSPPDSEINEYLHSGMPGGLSKEDLEIIQGKAITEEQYEKIRKQI